MGLADDAYEFMVAAIIIVVMLYVIAVMVTDFAAQNPLFADIMFGGGVLVAIVAGAVAILNRRG